jgi:Zn finger protein HypA/HybF involved in hydrogenase expression
MIAYCVKCKSRKTMSNPTKVKMKNGRSAYKGNCPNCGTKMFRIGG